jgi:hypothetical protein
MEDEERRKIVFWSGPEKEEKLEAIRVKPIGSGTFGRCELIRDMHTGKYFCLKTCKLTQVRNRKICQSCSAPLSPATIFTAFGSTLPLF